MLQVHSLRASLSLVCILAFVGVADADSGTFASQVEGLSAVALAELPDGKARSDDPASERCTMPEKELLTPAGQLVATRNWLVTAEIEHADYTFVSFVGHAESGTSSSCYLSDGNVAVFQGTKLLGVVYANNMATRDIGLVHALEGDRLRIFDGGYPYMPLADLKVVDDDLIIVGNVADRDSFCSDSVSVPNIRNLAIHDARRVLFSEGWTADPNRGEDDGWKGGFSPPLPEVDVCSGTGYGFCALDYVRHGSEHLRVGTVGEGNRVYYFSASCE
jgi:hypothetical protein